MSTRLGLDWWDLTLHVGATLFAAAAVTALEPGAAEVSLPVVFGVSTLVLAIRRRLALRRQSREITTGEVEAMRLEELEQRVADLETAAARMAELEERMDFSERLLVQARAASGEESTPPVRAARLEAND